MSHELAALRQKCKEQDSNLDHQQHLVSTFEKELTLSKHDSGSLQQQNHGLTAEMNLARQTIAEAQHEITQLRKSQQQHSSLDSAYSQLRAEHSRSAEQIAVLQQQLSPLR